MWLKTIINEDFNNYKKPSMVLAFPSCTFKCDLECGKNVCQNSELTKSENKFYHIEYIIEKYLNNNITHSIVCGGLEPMDSFNDLLEFIHKFRRVSTDDIIIYTGYNENEIQENINILSKYENIIIKFGRFVPNQQSHYDEILGVKLASDNQYARKIS